VPFERRNVDLADRPAWFKAISPLGKVPLLCAGDSVLFESAAIVEYLRTPRPIPASHGSAGAGAAPRWMEFGSSILADIWIIETTADPAAFEPSAGCCAKNSAASKDELVGDAVFRGRRVHLWSTPYSRRSSAFDVFDRFVDLGAFEACQGPALAPRVGDRPSGAAPSSPTTRKNWSFRAPAEFPHGDADGLSRDVGGAPAASHATRQSTMRLRLVVNQPCPQFYGMSRCFNRR